MRPRGENAAAAARARRPGRRRRFLAALKRGALWSLLLVAVASGYGAFLLVRTQQGAAILADTENRAIRATAALGLVVGDIEVTGRDTTDAATIMAALAAQRGTPILAVSPSRAQRQLEALPWVRSAAIERHLPGTLVVRLVERHPLAVWQHDGRQELIDRDGEVIPVTNLAHFAKLPTIVGEHAAPHAAALLAMLASQPELAARVTAAVRVDDRRWNLRLDNAIDVLLPEEEPQAAWARLAALERKDRLLQRDILAVDLRLPDRLVLRVNHPPPPVKEAAPAKKGKST